MGNIWKGRWRKILIIDKFPKFYNFKIKSHLTIFNIKLFDFKKFGLYRIIFMKFKLFKMIFNFHYSISSSELISGEVFTCFWYSIS